MLDNLARKPVVPLPDLDRLPASALLTRNQVCALSGFARITLTVWSRNGRGPKITVVEGRPRYRAGDVIAWMGARA